MFSFASEIRLCLLFVIFFLASSLLNAHNIDQRGIQDISWQTEQISQAQAALNIFSPSNAITKVVEGKQCIESNGAALLFDVRDDFASDIDEAIEIEIEFYFPDKTDKNDLILTYDRNGSGGNVREIEFSDSQDKYWYKKNYTLDRARLSGRRVYWIYQGDFAILGKSLMQESLKFTVCGVKIKRTKNVTDKEAYGYLSLSIFDEKGNKTPARIGIYDEKGRMPTPSEHAVPVKYFESSVTMIPIHPKTMPLDPWISSWPIQYRYAFYTDGSYQARLPAGEYSIIAAKGLEYRIIDESFVIRPDQETHHEITLSRWKDMNEGGWYSGDVHVHTGVSDQLEASRVRAQAMAEDLNLTNTLQMGNIGAVHFQQNYWQSGTSYGKPPFSLVRGQEDPRTHRFGHTIQLNTDQPVRNPERYYLYNEIFEKVRKRGGLTGYAHTGLNNTGVRSGMALDVPYGLVDLAEIMSFGDMKLDNWFDFLNLGYKLTPVAGSDYPYINVPGAVRSYVKLGDKYSVKEWFNSLKSGHTFSTNGPMLAFSINDRGMGSEIHAMKGSALKIEASASINPDIDLLDKIELIQQGEVVAEISSLEGAEDLALEYEAKADSGRWYVLRAYGKRQAPYKSVLAVSAPIYISVDGSGFCKPPAVAPIVSKLKELVENALSLPVDEIVDIEPWDGLTLRRNYWPSNKEILLERKKEVFSKYDQMVRLAKSQNCIASQR